MIEGSVNEFFQPKMPEAKSFDIFENSAENESFMNDDLSESNKICNDESSLLESCYKVDGSFKIFKAEIIRGGVSLIPAEVKINKLRNGVSSISEIINEEDHDRLVKAKLDESGEIEELFGSESLTPIIQKALEEGRLTADGKVIDRSVKVKAMSKEEYALFRQATFSAFKNIADFHKRLNAEKEKIQKNLQDGHYPLKARDVQIEKRDKKTLEHVKHGKRIFIEKLRNFKKESAEIASEVEKRKEKLKKEILKVYDTLHQHLIFKRNQREGEGKKIQAHVKNWERTS